MRPKYLCTLYWVFVWRSWLIDEAQSHSNEFGHHLSNHHGSIVTSIAKKKSLRCHCSRVPENTRLRSRYASLGEKTLRPHLRYFVVLFFYRRRLVGKLWPTISSLQPHASVATTCTPKTHGITEYSKHFPTNCWLTRITGINYLSCHVLSVTEIIAWFRIQGWRE